MTTLHIEVPGTVLLGDGALGLALDRVLTVDAEIGDAGGPVTGDERAVDAYRAFPARALPGATLTVRQTVPPALGVAVAVSVAGLVAAAAATETKDAAAEIVRQVSLLTGDVVRSAAAVYGGVMTGFRAGEEVHTAPVASHLALDVLLAIPARPFAPMPAAPDPGRLAYLVSSLIWGRWDRIAPAMGGVADVPPDTGSLLGAACAAGAYSTVADNVIIALAPHESADAVLTALKTRGDEMAWEGEVARTTIRASGATAKKEEPESGAGA